ncbi:MAG TPA: GNAT family N-acetyltransferase [Candidatus Dormibacteraeota bacterium]|nr:GNAT family N-acetyltransferase [Candidatus Dormibacteraeota bacterium]
MNFNDVTPDEIGAWLRYDALMCEESPLVPFQLARASLNSLPAQVSVQLFVGRDSGGEVTAEGKIVMATSMDQQRNCQIHISVHPQWRKKGLARSMLSLLVGVAEGNNRSTMVGWTTDRVDAGSQFAKMLGAERLDELILNRLVLSEVNRPLIMQWTTNEVASSGDYRMLLIEGPYPEEILAAVFELRNSTRTINGDELLHELPVTTIEEARALEAWWPTERRRWSIIVRPRESDELAGFTELNFRGSDPDLVYQAATIVHPNHRGLGLAKWLKAAMLQEIISELPHVQELHTGNASWNQPILSLNRALGFQPWVAATAWRLDVARARDAIQASAVAASS